MGKAFCINPNHPDFLELVEKSKLKPQIVSAKCSLFMSQNNTEKFPTLENLLHKTDFKLREKYFSTGSVQPVMSILNNMAQGGTPLSALAQHLKQFVKEDFLIRLSETPAISYLDAEGKERFAAGVSLWEKGAENERIVIAEWTNFRGSSEATILHEILHQLSQDTLLRDKNSTIYKHFEDLYNHAKDYLIGDLDSKLFSSEEKDMYYALKNLDEFLVALFTDAKFITILSEVPPMKTDGKFANLLQEVFNILLKALKITTASPFYNQAFSVATNILENQALRDQSMINSENREEEGPLADDTSQFNLSTPLSSFELYKELSDLGIITEFKGYHMIKKGTDININIRRFDEKNEEISKRLGLYPELVFSSYWSSNRKAKLVYVNHSLLQKDMKVQQIHKNTVEETKRWNDIMAHLQKAFPGIKVQVRSKESIRGFFPELSDEEFAKVTAFYSPNKGVIVLTDLENMSAETLVEEFLHPFINSIEGTPLFNSLMEEAKNRAKDTRGEFYNLYEKIKKNYATVYKGNAKSIDKEFLTQAISIIYTRQYNQKIDSPFSRLVARFKQRMLELLAKVGVNFSSIKDLNNLKISTLVELIQQEDFRWEIETSNTPDEKAWFNLQDTINLEIQKNLESRGIQALREKYSILYNVLTKSLNSAKRDKEIGSATLEDLTDKLSPSEVLASAEQIAQNMLTYYAGSSTFINVLLDGIKESKENKLLSDDELFSLVYKAQQSATALLPDLEQFYAEVRGLNKEDNPLIKQVWEAINNAKRIREEFEDLGIGPVAKELSKQMALSEADLQKHIDEGIKHLESALKDKAPGTKSYKTLEEKIKFLKKIKNFSASELNLASHLRGTSRFIAGEGDVDTFNRVDYDKNKKGDKENFLSDTLDSLWLAAMSSGNASVASVATFIKNTIQEGVQNYIDNNRQKIQTLKEEYFAQNPEISPEDLEEAFKKFTGVFENHYIDSSTGKLVTGPETEEVALLSENDHYAFNNDLTALKHKLSKETDLDKRDEISKDIEKFLKAHAEGLYTEEYEKIQDLLIPEARKARETIFKEINRFNAIREANKGELTEESLQELLDLYGELDRLESVFDENGRPKPVGSEELKIAESIKAFKKARREEDVVEYNITDKNKELWALKKKRIDEGYSNGSISQQERDLWYRTNVITSFKKEYYEELKHIWDDISRLLNLIPHDEESTQAKKDLEEYRSHLQDLSRGYKDHNGFVKADSALVKDGHMSEELVDKVKKLDEKIIDIKKYITKYSGLTEVEKNKLFSLKREFSQATDFNNREAIKKQIAILEQKMSKSALGVDQTRRLLNNFKKLGELSIEKESPYYEARWGIEMTNIIEKLIKDNPQLPAEDALSQAEELIKTTQWHNDNHVQKVVFVEHEGEEGEVYFLPETIFVPLSIWTKSTPVDEDYIEEESPSNAWTTYKIASGLTEKESTRLDFLKTTLSTLTDAEDIKEAQEEIAKLEKKSKKNYFNPNSKTINGRSKPKVSSTKYKNKTYESLSPKDKIFLEKYRELYYEAQKLVPVNQRNADKLPGIEKHALDRGISKYVTTSIPLLWVKLKAIFSQSSRLEEDPDYIRKQKNNWLRMKFQGKVKADRISYNLFDSLGDYSVEANIFNRTFANQKTVLTAQHLYNEKRGGTKAAKQISNLIDMLMFNEYDVRKGETLKRILSENQKISALLMLAMRPINALKNAGVGITSSLIYGNSPHYKRKDYFRALKTVKTILFESVIHDVRNPAKKNEWGLKIEKFNIVQGSLRDHIGKGFLNTITKGIFNKEILTKGRVMGEFLIQTALAEAISQSTLIPLNGIPTPIMDVYEVVDNKLVLKKGAYTDDKGVRWSDEDISLKEKQFMGWVEKYNVEINGNYSKLNKADIERDWSGKILLFMQKYIPTFIKERIGKESIDHITGQIKVGTYRALYELSIDILSDIKSIKSIYQGQTPYNRYRAGIAMRESLAWASFSVLAWVLGMMLVGHDDDDPITWAGWNILNLINQTNAELTTMNPFDALHDYLPLHKGGKTRELQLSSAEQWWDKVKNQMFWRRISGSAYVAQNVLTPLIIDGWNYALEGDAQVKGNKAIYRKDYGVHKKGDVKFFADLQKLIPGVKGGQDFLHPKEATDAWVYMNSLH